MDHSIKLEVINLQGECNLIIIFTIVPHYLSFLILFLYDNYSVQLLLVDGRISASLMMILLLPEFGENTFYTMYIRPFIYWLLMVRELVPYFYNHIVQTKPVINNKIKLLSNFIIFLNHKLIYDFLNYHEDFIKLGFNSIHQWIYIWNISLLCSTGIKRGIKISSKWK